MQIYRQKKRNQTGRETYSVWFMIMMFFVMSMLGWLWEVCLLLISEGRFVNRGVLHGPWLPVYGFGSVLIMMLFYRLRKWPLVEFLAIVLLCGCIEYSTSWYLETLYDGMKWWDYSGYPLNLDGRICVEGLLAFGVGGMLIVYFLIPLFERLFCRIPKKAVVFICILLIVLFGIDQIYSAKTPNTGDGITFCRTNKV